VDAARTKILNHRIRVIKHEVTERQEALWARTCDQAILNITNRNPPPLDADPKLQEWTYRLTRFHKTLAEAKAEDDANDRA
jgi:hypothetical protein